MRRTGRGHGCGLRSLKDTHPSPDVPRVRTTLHSANFHSDSELNHSYSFFRLPSFLHPNSVANLLNPTMSGTLSLSPGTSYGLRVRVPLTQGIPGTQDARGHPARPPPTGPPGLAAGPSFYLGLPASSFASGRPVRSGDPRVLNSRRRGGLPGHRLVDDARVGVSSTPCTGRTLPTSVARGVTVRSPCDIEKYTDRCVGTVLIHPSSFEQEFPPQESNTGRG